MQKSCRKFPSDPLIKVNNTKQPFVKQEILKESCQKALKN